MKRHALPATLTSAGRVCETWLPGPADALTGRARWCEVYRRFRAAHGRVAAVKLTLAAWRHGVTLSGSPVDNPEANRG